MLESLDWDALSDNERGFQCGYLVSKYQSAVANLADSIVLLADNSLSEKLRLSAWLKGDAALIALSSADFSKFVDSLSYHKIAPYLTTAGFPQVYIELRRSQGHVSPLPEMENLLQQAILKYR